MLPPDVSVFKNDGVPEMVVLVTGRKLTVEEREAIESFINNTCPHCGEHVDVPELPDGSEFECRSCGKLSVWTAFENESWALVAYDEEPETTGDEDMGIHADAKAMAQMSGLDVKVCKRALQEAGTAASELSTEGKLELCFPDGPPDGYTPPEPEPKAMTEEELIDALAEKPPYPTLPAPPAPPAEEPKAEEPTPVDAVVDATPAAEPEHIVTDDEEVIETGMAEEIENHNAPGVTYDGDDDADAAEAPTDD